MIIDTSVLIHAWRSGERTPGWLERLVASEGLQIIEPVRLEAVRGARNPAEARRAIAWLGQPNRTTIDAGIWSWAERTLVLLADLPGGQHRGVSLTDLLVAAVAFKGGHTVLHRDRDFDLIASVTGQPVRWFGAPA